MKDCCKSTNKDKECVRKSDGKTFTLPRRFSKKRCKQGIKGFTMRSSCAPYKDCLTMRKKKKKGGNPKTYKKNMLNKEIKVCSTKPMTGFYRDGYCMTGQEDRGTHTICAKMDKEFLDYTASKGNDLSSVVKPGQKWCLCEYRWQEAFKDGKAPPVVMEATNMRTKKDIRKNIKTHSKTRKEIAYFAGGCFWGLESKFKTVEGVVDTEVGFMGDKKKATYKEVCMNTTNHAETVKVVYDNNKISFEELVRLFFDFHDPTTLDRQGNDVGKQYRSIAFYSTKLEQQIIQSYIQQSDKHIVTEVKKKMSFFKAEEKHQDYNEKQTFQRICKHNSTLAEPTYSGKYVKEPYVSGKKQGIYVCPQCKNPLYDSNDAFNSHTGWPAFSDTIDKKGLSISKHIDYNKKTKELTCKNCGLHLGHRFIKGTKIHDCVNSVCLEFKPSKKGGSNKKTKKQFLFNPKNPKKSFDVYIDKDPSDTIPIKYTSLKDVKDTIKNLEHLYKQGRYPHKRIWQVGMILYVRLKVLKNKKKEHYTLAKRYFKFLGKRTKIKGEKDRKKYTFTI